MAVVGFVGAVVVDNVQMSVGSDSSRCLAVSPKVVSAIETGLTSGGESLRFARAVRLEGF